MFYDGKTLFIIFCKFKFTISRAKHISNFAKVIGQRQKSQLLGTAFMKCSCEARLAPYSKVTVPCEQ